jgi:hypothetical protein
LSRVFEHGGITESICIVSNIVKVSYTAAHVDRSKVKVMIRKYNKEMPTEFKVQSA